MVSEGGREVAVGGSSTVPRELSAPVPGSVVSDSVMRAASDRTRVVSDPSGNPVSSGVLCFDEVQFMDIADATVVTGVLDRLFSAGWVLVATCTRTPSEFAESVLHREHPQARFTTRVQALCQPAPSTAGAVWAAVLYMLLDRCPVGAIVVDMTVPMLPIYE